MFCSEIRSRCFVNTNDRADTFVGIKCKNGDISINFPIGFSVSESDTELRSDILLLLKVLALNSDKKESELSGQIRKYNKVAFPIQAYMAIIEDYRARGYYREREMEYSVSKRGKINWNRTIKTQKPCIQGHEVFYVNFITKKNALSENELITLMHKFCVYDSFIKIGWLYSGYIPARPEIKFNRKWFASVIKDKLLRTYNDKNKVLFKNMLAIINFVGGDASNINYKYGTYRFEYVWEKMIDRVFGIDNKAKYFPGSSWKIGQNFHANSLLRPDTIMVLDKKVYILDAKYYRYGITKNPFHLPDSTSVNKQITYGEYIAVSKQFKKVYNAFLMPYDSLAGVFPTGNKFFFVGEANSNWKKNDIEYEKIRGILIDVKFLMKIRVKRDREAIQELAGIIERSADKLE